MTAFDRGPAACPAYVEVELQRRPANALNLEIGQPRTRCRCKTPEKWGGIDPRATRWLLSGGDPLILGICESRGCPLPGDYP